MKSKILLDPCDKLLFYLLEVALLYIYMYIYIYNIYVHIYIHMLSGNFTQLWKTYQFVDIPIKHGDFPELHEIRSNAVNPRMKHAL